MGNNPFAIVSPEYLNAEQANQLFVDLYSDYPEVTRAGNTFITGARGCGKSMLIRCSLSDVLMMREQKKFSELPFAAFCIPIKKTSLNLQELQSLENKHAPYMLNEHFMAIHVMMYIFLQLSKIPIEYNERKYKDFICNFYEKKLKGAGYREEFQIDYSSSNSLFYSLYTQMSNMVDDFVLYLNRLLFVDKLDYSYDLPIISFTRFIVPVLEQIMALPGFPKSKPIFIFIDDADNLSEIQARILNTWLASRTQPMISLKISTQIGSYKTFLTSNKILIEAPHDYQEVNISYLLTNKNEDFYKKAVNILEKRLSIALINVPLNQFFPVDEQQQLKIQEEEQRIKENYEIAGRGYRVNDDVRRYAIPNYIRDLGGKRKSRYTYKYAGLDNIIHLSSGIIRYLLDATGKMYDYASNGVVNSSVAQISPSIQNRVMREKANEYLFNELRKGKGSNKEILAVSSNPDNLTDKLANLINAMGSTFHEILISDRAERKVFSIALSNNPDDELMQVFNLGVRLGFLHESFIGNKDGNGKTYLYVLNRCFAPVFTLDPTGFQGYLFMTNEDLKKAVRSGKYLRKIGNNNDDDDEVKQLTLDDFWEE